MSDRTEQQQSSDQVILKKTKVLPKLNDVRGWSNALSVGFCHGFFPQGAGKQQATPGAQNKPTTDVVVFNPEKRWVSFKETKEKQLRTPVELELVQQQPTGSATTSTSATTPTTSSVPLHAEVIHFEDHFTTADEYFHRLRVDEGDYHSYRHSGGFHWFVLQRANAPPPPSNLPQTQTVPSNVDTSILRISKVKEVLHLRKMPNLKPKEELSAEALKRATRGKKAFKKSLKALRTEEDRLYSALDGDGDDAFEVASEEDRAEEGNEREGEAHPPNRKRTAGDEDDAEREAEVSVDRESGSGSDDDVEVDEREMDDRPKQAQRRSDAAPASKKPRHELKDEGAAAGGGSGGPAVRGRPIPPPSDLLALCRSVIERQKGKHVDKATVVNTIVKQSSEFSTWVERSDEEFDEWSRVARLETERCLAQLQCKILGQDILFPL